MTVGPGTGSDRPVLAGYPANLLVAGRRCVVVGAGRIAHRKITGLLAQGALVTVVAPDADPEVRALVEAGRCTWESRPFAAEDLDGAWLAVTATGDPSVDRAVFEAGEARRVWVNSADDPANCSFSLMAVVRRGDIVVAIGTNGRSPALTTYLADRVRDEVGPEYETLLGILADAREELQAAGRPTEDADWRAAFDSGILDLIRAGRLTEARELLRSCL